MPPQPQPNTTKVTATGPPYPLAPAPWQLRGDVYLISFWTSSAVASNLPAHAYSPLEAASDFASAASPISQPKGGISQIQLIRYTESPVGPYDEMMIIPGMWDVQRDGSDGRRGQRKRNPRVTRIYVSQPHTCHNGRTNWGVPKHLARFDYTTHPDGTTTFKVFPHDTHPDITDASTSSESQPSPTPLFQATFKPIPYVPSFPFSTGWASSLGLDLTLVQPPIPAGPHASLEELPKTDKWIATQPNEYSRRCELGWFDMAQGESAPREDCPNFWPGLGRWQLGVRMVDAVVDFGVPEMWDAPRSSL